MSVDTMSILYVVHSCTFVATCVQMYTSILCVCAELFNCGFMCVKCVREIPFESMRTCVAAEDGQVLPDFYGHRYLFL